MFFTSKMTEKGINTCLRSKIKDSRRLMKKFSVAWNQKGPEGQIFTLHTCVRDIQCFLNMMTLFCSSFLRSSQLSSLSADGIKPSLTEDGIPKSDIPINPPASCGCCSFLIYILSCFLISLFPPGNSNILHSLTLIFTVICTV